MSTLELNHKNGREVNSPGASPPSLNNHGLGSEAPQSVQAPISAPSTTPLDPVAITPLAARTHAQGLALPVVRFGGALATYIYPLGSERLPPKLVHSKIWLVWKSVPKSDPSKKPDKVPYYVTGVRRSGSLDSAEDRAQLASFDEAIDAYWQGGYDGLAIALGPDGSGNCWQGIDFDDVEQRQLSDLANDLPGYVDFSPSGKGCHAIGYGRPFRTLGSNASGVEAYAEKRFFTFTGCIIRNAGIGCIADFVEQQVAPVHGAARHRDASQSESVFVDPKTVTELRSALHHMRSDGRELWINMGHALHGLGNVGRGLWLDWSKISEKFLPEDAKKWDSFKPDRTDYRAVFAEAQRQGWVNPNSNAANRITGLAFAHVAEGKELIERLRIHPEADEPSDVPDLVPDLVADEEVTLLGGHGGIGKSFLALQIACSLAAGLGIFGKNIPTAKRVLYYSAEDGAKRINRRLKLICDDCGIDASVLADNLLVINGTEQEPLFGEPAREKQHYGKPQQKSLGTTTDYENLQGMVIAFEPDLLIVDGASDTFDGNEIARRDVRAFMRALQRLHPNRRIGVLLLVHIDRSSARGNVTSDDGYSGSSQWHNAARRRLYLQLDNKTQRLYLRVMKNQDGPPAPDLELMRANGLLRLAVQFGPQFQEQEGAQRDALLALIDEYSKRGHSIGTSLALQATTGIYKTLKDDPKFPVGLDFKRTCQLARAAQQAGMLVEEEYVYSRGKRHTRWKVNIAQGAQ
ncbi:MAG: AAA family ATPase [Pseudomonadota bacterium]